MIEPHPDDLARHTLAGPPPHLAARGVDIGWLQSPIAMSIREAGPSVLTHVVLASLLIACLALALPIVLLQTYDRIIPSASFGTLSLLAAGALLACVLESALRMARSNILGRIAAKGEAEAHAAAIGRLLQAPSAIFERQGNGYYSERLSAIGGLREAWSGTSLQTMLDVPFSLLYFFAIWLLAGQLAVVPLGLLLCVAATAWFTGRLTRRGAHQLARAEERRFNFLLDTLRGFGTIKLLGAERLFERRYERLQGTTADLRRSLTRATAAGQEAGIFLAQLSAIAIGAWGCLLVLDGEMTVGGLGACAMLTGRCIQPLLNGASLWSRHQALADAKARVAELAAIPTEDRPDLPPLCVSEGRIALRGIRHGEMAGGGWLFDDLSLDVPPGQILGIDSANGSGRSTLFRLISGEQAPDFGDVEIDGQNLKTHDAARARPSIALVPPDPALVRGTLLQNMTLFQSALEEDALIAGQALGLGDVASSLAEGWHAEIGPGAAPVARGVAQRIGLVRALIQRPGILLLDDVTAQLDAAGDIGLTRVLANLRGDCTILLASHRRSVLAAADRVVEIHEGRLRPVS